MSNANLIGTAKTGPDPALRCILVTGAAGFILYSASWVARHLVLTYVGSYHIVGFDKFDYCASLKNLSGIHPSGNFSLFRGDITNKDDVARCIRQFRVDAIIHFAALSHVDRSFEDGEKYTTVNVIGTQTLLKVAAEAAVKKFIHVSTDEVAGDAAMDLLGAASRFQPTNPYAASKAAAEVYVEAYSRTYAMNCIIVRSNNLYGPCQYPEKIIPAFITRILCNKNLELQGSGHNRRRYVYASDAVNAFDIILHKGEIGKIYCITSPDEASNLEIAHRLLELFKIPASDIRKRICYVADRPYNDARYNMDGRALEHLGWKSRVRLNEGLRLTKDWFVEQGSEWWIGGAKQEKACL